MIEAAQQGHLHQCGSCVETQNGDRCNISRIDLFVVWQPGIYLSLLNNKCLAK